MATKKKRKKKLILGWIRTHDLPITMIDWDRADRECKPNFSRIFGIAFASATSFTSHSVEIWQFSCNSDFT